MVAGAGFKTKLACLIAGVDRQQFNEAVAKKYYPCAVRTDLGSSRVFFVPDMVALLIFGRLLALGFSTKLAGMLACKAHVCFSGFVRDCINLDPAVSVEAVLSESPYLVLQFPEMGEPTAFITGDMRRAFKQQKGVSVRHVMAFNVHDLHERVAQEIEHHKQNLVFGDDE